jgi:predicted O-methyltransferase YrrM
VRESASATSAGHGVRCGRVTPTPVFLDEQTMRLGEIDLHVAFPFGVVPEGRLAVMKPRDLVRRYVELCTWLQPRRIVELGINRGGSTAMLSELTTPEVLVALELDAEPVVLLADYVKARGIGTSVQPHYGVDQADRAKVADIVDRARDGELLDLVVDDASHLYEPSRASFETLFPRLRPAGVYVIEDWSWEHRYSDRLAAMLTEDTEKASQMRQQLEQRLEAEATGSASPEPPVSRLAIELLQVRARPADVVREITIDEHWITVVRGDEPLEVDSPWMADAYIDHFGQVGARRAVPGSD